MARSLIIKHEENPRVSMLFLTFLGLSCGVMFLTWWTAAAEGTIEIEAPPALNALP